MTKRQGERALGKTTQRHRERQNASTPSVFPFCKHIPNALTILRLLGTPLTLWIIAQGELTSAFWVFFAICLTDWLDGYLARRLRVTSKLGQVLDPLADKFLLISMYLVLALWEFIPMWLTILVVMRDIFILTVSGGIILSQKINIHLVPQFIGKMSTTLQMLFISLVLAGGVPIPSLPTSSVESLLMVLFLYSVALTTILSGFTYAQVVFNAFGKP